MIFTPIFQEMNIKKLTVILLLIPILANAQNGLIWGVDFNEQDKQAHGGFGYFTGVVFNCAAYNILEDTEMKPWLAKAISFFVGSGSSLLLGHLKDKRDRKQGRTYNIKDVKATFMGGIAGSGTISLAFYIFLPNKKLPEGTIIYENKEDVPGWSLDNEFLNNK
jgi:hypothetical protein